MKPFFGKPRCTPQQNKAYNLPSGVSVFVEAGRRPGSSPCITFGVLFRAFGRRDVRKFRTPVDASDAVIEHARRTAIAFRAAYVRSARAGEPFDPASFSEWRSRNLYT